MILRRLVFSLALILYAGNVNASFERLVEKVAKHKKMPSWVLMSVCVHESQSFHKGKRQAWPWTLNVNGKGFWFKTENAAVAYAELALDEGVKNIDVGTCQINWRWHGHKFESIRQLINPLNNLNYAADYLLEQKGNKTWEYAIGAYHSPSNKEKAKQYAKFVMRYVD